MCSVVGCDRRSAQAFKLPEDPERRLEWVQFLFEVNGQRLKESSWTDIAICGDHFTEDCFVDMSPSTGMVQLKSCAVPSQFIQPEPQEPDTHQVRTKYWWRPYFNSLNFQLSVHRNTHKLPPPTYAAYQANVVLTPHFL